MVATFVDIIGELTQFHRFFEPHQKEEFDNTRVRRYFESLLDQNLIVIRLDNESHVAGYAEFWRIDYARLGWLCLGEDLNPLIHTLTKGPICYVANTTIHPRYHGLGIIEGLRDDVLSINSDATWICGHRPGKRHEPLIIFHRKTKER